MIGITRVGTYFPRRRLDRGLLTKAWGTRARGTRTVAAIDEDPLTMGIEAVTACVGDVPDGIDALYFASTSAPYLEKQVASMIVTAVDLPRSTVVADFAGSTRTGLAALRTALDGIGAGTLHRVLAVASDARLAEPESALEAQLGDAAACIEVGSDDVVAELVSTAGLAQEFTHFWRTDQQRYVQLSDARFGNQYGYAADVPDAVTAALRKADLPPENVAAYALAAPDARAAAAAAKRLGVNPETQLVAPLVEEAGVLGAPDPYVLLSRALETAKPGEFVVVAAYGEGADALIFRATAALAAARPRPVADALAGGLPLASYEKYLRARGVLPADVGGEFFSTYMEWQELAQDVRLYGTRCGDCGLVQYPQNRVCHQCHSREHMSEHKLAKHGVVFTYTIDNLAQVAEHPMPMVVVDLDGGGRVYMQGTDCADGDIEIGARVRLTYRRLHEAGGNRNYYWKVRPA